METKMALEINFNSLTHICNVQRHHLVDPTQTTGDAMGDRRMQGTSYARWLPSDRSVLSDGWSRSLHLLPPFPLFMHQEMSAQITHAIEGFSTAWSWARIR